jgi:hypothetical protein
MIRVLLNGAKWGTDPIEEVTPEGEVILGRQINLLDEKSGFLFLVPFTGDPLKELIHELAKGLTDEQRREVTRRISGGLILPGNGIPRDRP